MSTTLPASAARQARPRYVRRAWAGALALCLTTVMAACGSDSSTGPGGDSNDGPGGNPGGTPGTEVPSELAGAWRYGSISPTNFWDDHTGQYMGNAYGFGDFLSFERSGRYTRLVYIYTNSYGCQTQVWTQMEGTVRVDGFTFALYPTKGRYKVADNCAASRNYERPMTGDELAEKQGDLYNFTFANENGRSYLMIGVGDSEERAHYEADE